jgi:hypothetical protein
MTEKSITAARLARLIRKCLDEGNPVEIEGLGTFRLRSPGVYEFAAETRPRVFIAYMTEDAGRADRLYQLLGQAGVEPWMDRHNLLPGQNWPKALEQAIEVSDYFVACFSRRIMTRRSSFQLELRHAMLCARKVPFDDVFVIPVRLEECSPPKEIAAQYQWVDLFPDLGAGVRRLVNMIRRQERQSRRRLRVAS